MTEKTTTATFGREEVPIDEKGLSIANNTAARINYLREQRIKEAELRSDLDGLTSKCRKKAGYK